MKTICTKFPAFCRGSTIKSWLVVFINTCLERIRKVLMMPEVLLNFLAVDNWDRRFVLQLHLRSNAFWNLAPRILSRRRPHELWIEFFGFSIFDFLYFFQMRIEPVYKRLEILSTFSYLLTWFPNFIAYALSPTSGTLAVGPKCFCFIPNAPSNGWNTF